MTKYIKIEEELRNLSITPIEYKRLNHKSKIAQIRPIDAIDCELLNFTIVNSKDIEVGSINEDFDDGNNDVGIFKSRGSENYFLVHLETTDKYEDNYEYVEFPTLQEALDFIHKHI